MQQNVEVRRDEEFDCKGQDHVVMVRSAMRRMLAEIMGRTGVHRYGLGAQSRSIGTKNIGSISMDHSRNQNMSLV